MARQCLLKYKQLIRDIKAWRNAWDDILKFQYDASEAFATIYKPMEATGEGAEEVRHQPAQTPAKYMQKCLGLQKEYSDEKADLAQEITMITDKLLRPAEEAKQHTKLLQKTLKHRENMKLDYERYLNRAEHARKKETRTVKDEQNLQSCEANLAQSLIDTQSADDHVKQTFPPVTASVLSLLPYLLAKQVKLQTTFVGQLYTILDEYTRKFGFPNPAPPDGEIISNWESEFSSFRKEVESGIAMISGGKAVHMSMNLPAEKDKSTVTGLGIRNKVINRKDSKPTPTPYKASGGSSSQGSTPGLLEGPSEEVAPAKPPRPGGMPSPNTSPSINLSSKPRIGSNTPAPSNGMYDQSPPPPYDQKPTALIPGYPHQATNQIAGSATPPSHYQTPVNGSASPMPSATSPLPSAGMDYFGNRRSSQASSIASSAAGMAAKKKPPPPIPAKRIPSAPLPQYVTALFDFEGQSEGDLAFKEGDKIRVVKKTDSQDDWWDGELRGKVGVFPANYVQL